MRVVLVEDEEITREIVESALRGKAIDVTSFSSGEDAVGLLDNGFTPDSLITDINLPGEVDGWTVAHVFREEHPKLPIIYITATREMTDHVTKSVYLRKPIKMQLLLEAVAAFT